jgi:hypothetical protein
MLGQFLECSIAARSLAEAFEFYRAAGFSSQPTSDVLPHPYVVMSDGVIAIGLHDRDAPSPALTFVRPQLQHYVRALRRRKIRLETVELADDRFNHIVFEDPNGQAVVLLEARTFSPTAPPASSVPICGRFLEYSVGVSSLEETAEFWLALGMSEVARGSAPHPWVRLAGHGLVLGLHLAHVPPGVSFSTAQLAARMEYLRASGLPIRPGSPFTVERGSATLSAPNGLKLYLLAEPGEAS